MRSREGYLEGYNLIRSRVTTTHYMYLRGSLFHCFYTARPLTVHSLSLHPPPAPHPPSFYLDSVHHHVDNHIEWAT